MKVRHETELVSDFHSNQYDLVRNLSLDKRTLSDNLQNEYVPLYHMLFVAFPMVGLYIFKK